MHYSSPSLDTVVWRTTSLTCLLSITPRRVFLRWFCSSLIGKLIKIPEQVAVDSCKELWQATLVGNRLQNWGEKLAHWRPLQIEADNNPSFQCTCQCLVRYLCRFLSIGTCLTQASSNTMATHSSPWIWQWVHVAWLSLSWVATYWRLSLQSCSGIELRQIVLDCSVATRYGSRMMTLMR